jgi:hypothetical protein
MPELARIYAALRPLMKDGAHVLFKSTKAGWVFDGAELFLSGCDFPDLDISEINFRGSAVLALLRALYIPAMRPVSTRPLARAVIICTLIAMAPLVWLANAWAARGDLSLFSSTWTSLTVEFLVKHRHPVAPTQAPGVASSSGANP